MQLSRTPSSFFLLAIFGAVVGFPGCGGSSDKPAGPTTQTVATITLSAASADPIASLGETRNITAVAKDANQGTITSPSLTWTSSAPSVATVVGTGASATVTSVGNGSATITASSGSIQNAITITVAQRASSVALTGIPTSVTPGAAIQLRAEARDARQQAVAGATGFTFATSDQSVAVVSASGLLTAIAPGTATISSTVTQGGVTVNGSSPITVAFGISNPTSATVNATTNRTFTPPSVLVAPGGTVTWDFASLLHNVTFRGGTGVPASIPNTASAQVSRTFPTAGMFSYDCTLHSGMQGTVVVQTSTSGPSFIALLNGANERPNAVTTAGRGSAAFTVSGPTVTYTVAFSQLTGAPVGAHIHAPGSTSQNAAIVVDFPTAGQTATNGVLTGSFTATNIRGIAGQPAFSLDSLLTLMRNGNAYVNVHTPMFGGGEVRGQIAVP